MKPSGKLRDTLGTPRDTQVYPWTLIESSWNPQGQPGTLMEILCHNFEKIYTLHDQSCLPTPTVTKAKKVPWTSQRRRSKRRRTQLIFSEHFQFFLLFFQLSGKEGANAFAGGGNGVTGGLPGVHLKANETPIYFRASQRSSISFL